METMVRKSLASCQKKASNPPSAAGCGLTVSWSSCSDRPRILHDVSAVFSKFLSDFAVFGDVGG